MNARPNNPLDSRNKPAVDAYFSADVETDGPIPGPFSMLSFGLVFAGTFDGSRYRRPDEFNICFYRELQPISEEFQAEALAVNGLDRARLIREGEPPRKAITAAAHWIYEVAGRARPVLVAYPLSFDWSWLYWYFVRFSDVWLSLWIFEMFRHQNRCCGESEVANLRIRTRTPGSGASVETSTHTTLWTTPSGRRRSSPTFSNGRGSMDELTNRREQSGRRFDEYRGLLERASSLVAGKHAFMPQVLKAASRRVDTATSTFLLWVGATANRDPMALRAVCFALWTKFWLRLI